MNKVIEIKNVTLSFKDKREAKKILDNISFDVYSGSIHGFIGPNGVGKTTTIRTILGFYPKYEGSILLNGIDSKLAESKKKLGYVPEFENLTNSFTVKDFLNSFAMINGIENKNDADKKIKQLMSKVRLSEDLSKSKLGRLSSGQKKKVLLIQALMNDPDIIILDEPTANLDPETRVEVYEILQELKEKGKTIFISSHILDELNNYVDSYTIFKDGEIKYNGPKQIIENKWSYQIKAVKNPQQLLKAFEEIVKENSDIEFQEHRDLILFNCEQENLKEIVSYLIRNDIKFERFGEYNPTLYDQYLDK